MHSAAQKAHPISGYTAAECHIMVGASLSRKTRQALPEPGFLHRPAFFNHILALQTNLR